MAEITAALVSQLRQMTNAGFMDCKRALTETKGDINLAVDVLRKKGMATAVKKAMRETKDGMIVQHIQPGARVGVLVEINCESDFVARNDVFGAFCEEATRTLAADPKADLESARTAAVAKTGENIRISRLKRFEVSGNGMVAAYIHTGAKVGVLVEVGAGLESTVQRDEFKQLVRDITLQIAAASPLAVSPDQLDPAAVEKEREIAREQVKNKPPAVIEKIVAGKLDKYYQTVCLLSQGFVKQNSEISMQEYLSSVGKLLADELTIRRFVRFQVGEAFSD
ncbi:MAG: translation elongation factor Ts [Candidatus Omnitrophica bacterium]|nr:translation elongation factor Ts [Candidatus Omnitrophota bacterium]